MFRTVPIGRLNDHELCARRSDGKKDQRRQMSCRDWRVNFPDLLFVRPAQRPEREEVTQQSWPPAHTGDALHFACLKSMRTLPLILLDRMVLYVLRTAFRTFSLLWWFMSPLFDLLRKIYGSLTKESEEWGKVEKSKNKKMLEELLIRSYLTVS